MLPCGKSYGKWWNILSSLVESRESAGPLNIVESCFDNGNQNTDLQNDLEGSKNATADEKGECQLKKNKEAIEQSLLILTKSFTDNDPTKKQLKFMAEGNKKLRKHEMEMMKLIFGQLHPPSAMPFHYHGPSSNGNCSCFQQIPYHQNHITAGGKEHKRIRILSTICYKHHSRKHIILQSLTIKEIITSKQ